MPPKMFLVTSESGEPLRKVFCPEEDLELQLSVGETADEIDPLTDGFGVDSAGGPG